MKNSVLVSQDKSDTTVEKVLRGGLAPKVAGKGKPTGVEVIEDLFTELGKLSFSITNNKTAEKILKKKMYETPEGIKVKQIAAKKKKDMAEHDRIKNMLRGQLLMAKKQNLEIPETIKKSKLLSEGK